MDYSKDLPVYKQVPDKEQFLKELNSMKMKEVCKKYNVSRFIIALWAEELDIKYYREYR